MKTSPDVAFSPSGNQWIRQNILWMTLPSPSADVCDAQIRGFDRNRGMKEVATELCDEPVVVVQAVRKSEVRVAVSTEHVVYSITELRTCYLY